MTPCKNFKQNGYKGTVGLCINYRVYDNVVEAYVVPPMWPSDVDVFFGDREWIIQQSELRAKSIYGQDLQFNFKNPEKVA